jgi:hypothetical protein
MNADARIGTFDLRVEHLRKVRSTRAGLEGVRRCHATVSDDPSRCHAEGYAQEPSTANRDHDVRVEVALDLLGCGGKARTRGSARRLTDPEETASTVVARAEPAAAPVWP